MKKITTIFVILTMLFGFNLYAQDPAAIDVNAGWPNTNWDVFFNPGTTESGLTNDPRTTTNLSFDDFSVGTGDYLNGQTSIADLIYAISPIIDVTAATTASPVEEQLIITGEYVYYSNDDDLYIEYWDAGISSWVPWPYQFIGNSTNGDFISCSGTTTYTTTPLIITAFTPVQLQNFRYRISFNDNGHGYGFCFDSPTLKSRWTPLCFPVEDIVVNESTMTDEQATVSWNDVNGTTPEDGWDIEYGNTGFSIGSGTSFTTLSSPYTITGLSASTCYDVYVRAKCDATEDSEWAGPINFCTPINLAGCGDMFYDIGGPTGKYINGLDEITTICPDDAGDIVTVIFDAFSLEIGGAGPYDWLKIYDGDSTAATQIIGPDNNGTFSGNNSPGMISADIANGGCLTFEFHSDGSGTRDGWEAQILCSPPITCFMAEDLDVTEATIGIHQAELFWTDTNGAGEPTSGWDINYGLDGFDPATEGTIINVATNPFTLTGLADATDYCYYVRAECGDNLGDEVSFWEGPKCFTTKCDVYPVPFSQSFEEGDGDIPNCWEQGLANGEDWLFSNDVTAPGHIGDEGNVFGTTTLSGGYFAYVDDSSPNSLDTEMLSPFIDLGALANPVLGFYFISNHEFTNNNVAFSVDIWDGTSWHVGEYTHSGNSTGWQQVYVNLTAFAGNTIQIKFIVDENNTGVSDDFAIDDIYVGEIPSCANVNSIALTEITHNSVTLNWGDSNIPVEDEWQIVSGVVGFDPNAAVAADITDTTDNTDYLYGSLAESTTYDLYIRADCDTDGYSLWAGPVTFTTLCNPFTAPYHEDFEDGGFLDACWTQKAGVDAWRFSSNVAVPGHLGDAGDVFGTTTDSLGYFAWVDDDAPHALHNSITSPMIEISALVDPTLYFHYISHNEGSSNVDFSVDVWDGAAWILDFFTSNTNTIGWEEAMLNLTTIPNLGVAGPIQIRFTVDENNGTNFRDDFALDDVKVDEKPACWPIFDLAVSNETTTTVDLDWTDDNNGAITYGIEYGPIGFIPDGTYEVTTPSNPTLPYTVTGLDVDTDYDFYVFALCSGGTSPLGPVQGSTLPTCLEVNSISQSNPQLNSVDITWTDINPISPPIGGWDIKIMYPTDNFGVVDGVYSMLPGLIDTITLPSTTTFPFTIGGNIGDDVTARMRLIPSSFYHLYIRANCAMGDADSSRWTGPYIINTAIEAAGNRSNDTAQNAIELDVNVDCDPVNGGPALGNNLQSNETVPNLATTCTDPATDGMDNAYDRHDVWYKFTIPAGETSVLINTAFAGAMEDSAIMVYKGPWDGLTPAVSYLANGNVNNAIRSCNDDSDLDIGLASDNNDFSVVRLMNVTPGDEYYIRVWSFDATTLGNGYVQGQFTICLKGGTLNRFYAAYSAYFSTLNTEETVIEENSISLDYYPNPVSEVLQLQSNTNIKEVRIYSILGQELDKKVMERVAKETTVSMSNLISGTYFIKVLYDNDKSKTIKIIKR